MRQIVLSTLITLMISKESKLKMELKDHDWINFSKTKCSKDTFDLMGTGECLSEDELCMQFEHELAEMATNFGYKGDCTNKKGQLKLVHNNAEFACVETCAANFNEVCGMCLDTKFSKKDKTVKHVTAENKVRKSTKTVTKKTNVKKLIDKITKKGKKTDNKMRSKAARARQLKRAYKSAELKKHQLWGFRVRSFKKPVAKKPYAKKPVRRTVAKKTAKKPVAKKTTKKRVMTKEQKKSTAARARQLKRAYKSAELKKHQLWGFRVRSFKKPVAKKPTAKKPIRRTISRKTSNHTADSKTADKSHAAKKSHAT